MRLIEADMQTRVRKNSVYQDRTTGEMTWARFDHFTGPTPSTAFPIRTYTVIASPST